MKYFAVFLPMLDSEKSKAYREEHLAFLAEQSKAGKIFAKGRFVDGAGGLVIYIGKSLEEIEKIVLQDPYVIKQARGFVIHEWDMVTD